MKNRYDNGSKKELDHVSEVNSISAFTNSNNNNNVSKMNKIEMDGKIYSELQEVKSPSK